MPGDSDVKYCQNCGQQLKETARYCDRCGEPTETGELADSSTGDDRTSTHDTDQPERGAEAKTDPVSGTQPPEDRNQRNTISDIANWSAARKVALVGAALSVLSAFLPWYTADILGTSETITGLDGGGGVEVLLAGAAASAVTAWRWDRWRRVVVGVIGAFLLLSSFLYITSPLDWLQDPAPIVQENPNLIETGVGLYLTVAGGMLIFGGGVYDTLFRESPSQSADADKSQTTTGSGTKTTGESNLDSLSDGEYYKCVACGQPFQKARGAERHAEREKHTEFDTKEQ